MILRPGKVHWPLRVGVLIASLLFVLLAAEAFIRITIHQRGAAGAAASKSESPEYAELPILKGMFDLGRKNVRGMHKGVFFRTNSQRIRGPEYPQEAEAGVFRIAIVGDSVTMGEGVEESRAYPSLLGGMLAEKMPDKRFEVINVGLSGSNTRLAMDRLEKAVEFYRPDLIVYGFTINDIEGPNYRAPTRNMEELKELQSNQWFVNSPLIVVRLIWWTLAAANAPGASHRNWYAEELLYNYFGNESAKRDWDQELDRFPALARKKSICAHVLIHTHFNELDEDHPYLPIYQMVVEAAEQRGLPVSPTFDRFSGVDPQTLRLHFADAHPNAEGHAILAQALAEGLSEMPMDCWQEADYGQ